MSENDFEYQLVLVGRKDPHFRHIQELVAKSKLENYVKFIETVAEEDLPALYNAASAFVFPSLYEGFGLPVLEAMASGTPVVCSSKSSLPEVAGDAALLVDPNHVDLAKAIHKVLTNEAIQKKLTREGQARATRFSWQKTAAKTLEVYENIFRGRSKTHGPRSQK